MSFQEQLKKIKDNWLMVALVLLLVFTLMLSNMGSVSFSSSKALQGGANDAYYGTAPAYAESAIGRGSMPYYPYEQDFAPDQVERKLTKSGYLSAEVKRGTFYSSEAQFKNIISSSNSILLSENVNKQGKDRQSYLSGSYQLKVDVSKYDSVVSQLKNIGEVQSFSENTQDVTGEYVSAQASLETEKARLARYQQMYDEAVKVEDKIQLSDRIFNQEMQIKYLEERIKNLDQHVDYSTLHFTLTEKRSNYADIAVVKFSELIRAIVGSFNSLLALLFTLIPWALAVLLGVVIYKFAKRNKK